MNPHRDKLFTLLGEIKDFCFELMDIKFGRIYDPICSCPQILKLFFFSPNSVPYVFAL
mgnify:CR=1 FL=1